MVAAAPSVSGPNRHRPRYNEPRRQSPIGAAENGMARQQHRIPETKWEDNERAITPPLEDARVLNASWKPGVTYLVPIREAGEPDWSFGFETPITSFTFADLKPDTEYELQVRTQNAAGEGDPAFFSIRTGPTGDSSNVVPFRRR